MVRLRSFWALLVLFAGWGVAYDAYTSARQKFDLITSDRLRPGTRLTISPAELDAYVAREAPEGVRQTHVEFPAPGIARGSAMVDFARLRSSEGHPPGFLLSTLLAGERPVRVTARIHSADGQATVDVQKVEIGGMEIEGATLDFLIQNFLLPLYPDAAIGRPFELGHRIQKLDIQPAAVGVVIGR
jgi:hypothetical protein